MAVPIRIGAARERIARRIARSFDEQQRELVINLGVGIPTMVADYVTGSDIFVQAENGLLGVGRLAVGDQIDRQLINAGRQPVTETPGCSYFDSATSFGMIRGGHVDATVIGLSRWTKPAISPTGSTPAGGSSVSAAPWTWSPVPAR